MRGSSEPATEAKVLVNVVLLVLFAAMAAVVRDLARGPLPEVSPISELADCRAPKVLLVLSLVVAGVAASLVRVALAGLGLALFFYVLGCSW